MFKKILTAAILLNCVFLISACGQKSASKPARSIDVINNYANIMQITSSQFKNNEEMPDKYGCHGTNINPPLTISEVPAGAKSLALIIDDPDAARGNWTHWVMFNIPPETREIAEGQAPPGATQGTNDFGNGSYGEPCPPFGTHRYVFKIYALDTMLDLSAQTTKQDLEKAMVGHVFDRAEITGLFTRK
jgi:hypothetical protein